MHKIVVAADSFKGSLGSGEVADSVEAGILEVFPECEVDKIYIADGGEGTVEALVRTLAGEYVTVLVHDPLMRPIEARYGVIDNGRTAVIEMSAASGLPLLAHQERNPLKTTTYGTGELIADALKHGCRKFIVGIGGSATNDAGTGMLNALGYRFLDAKGHELDGTGENLEHIETIDPSQALPLLEESEFLVACDVQNPFCGPQGAACIFAPQKGASKESVVKLDRGLHRFAETIRRHCGIEVATLAGAGAAGGLGGGFKALLGATLVPGIEIVLSAMDFDHLIDDCDLIITGEGKLDAQTVMGKAPSGILQAAERKTVPVIAIGGSVEACEELCRQGFTAVFPIVPGPVTLERAMENEFARANIRRTIGQIMRTIKTIGQ